MTCRRHSIVIHTSHAIWIYGVRLRQWRRKIFSTMFWNVYEICPYLVEPFHFLEQISAYWTIKSGWNRSKQQDYIYIFFWHTCLDIKTTSVSTWWCGRRTRRRTGRRRPSAPSPSPASSSNWSTPRLALGRPWGMHSGKLSPLLTR